MASDDRTRRSPADIAAEAVGERDRSATPDIAKERAEMAPEDAVRQNAPSSGPRASAAAKAAESVGERVGDAYPDTVPLRAKRPRTALPISDQFAGQPFMTVVGGFALGYLAAFLLHGRR